MQYWGVRGTGFYGLLCSWDVHYVWGYYGSRYPRIKTNKYLTNVFTLTAKVFEGKQWTLVLLNLVSDFRTIKSYLRDNRRNLLGAKYDCLPHRSHHPDNSVRSSQA